MQMFTWCLHQFYLLEEFQKAAVLYAVHVNALCSRRGTLARRFIHTSIFFLMRDALHTTTGQVADFVRPEFKPFYI